MDTDILTQKIRARFDHNQARKVLKEKYTAKMFFACSGGMWKAGPELLNVLAVLKPQETAVITDIHDTPVKIIVAELEEKTRQRWQEQMNAWLHEYESMNQQR